jgi:hypothetical protein
MTYDLFDLLAPALVGGTAAGYALVWMWNFAKRVVR